MRRCVKNRLIKHGHDSAIGPGTESPASRAAKQLQIGPHARDVSISQPCVAKRPSGALRWSFHRPAARSNRRRRTVRKAADASREPDSPLQVGDVAPCFHCSAASAPADATSDGGACDSRSKPAAIAGRSQPPAKVVIFASPAKECSSKPLIRSKSDAGHGKIAASKRGFVGWPISLYQIDLKCICRSFAFCSAVAQCHELAAPHGFQRDVLRHTPAPSARNSCSVTTPGRQPPGAARHDRAAAGSRHRRTRGVARSCVARPSLRQRAA